ncbi:hypothetical protein POG22_21960 [Geitlerinema sp. CS-897]|nr:hypothetical protein [Geitlerinema sp. CS-897]
MTITVKLSPELEAKLQQKAAQQERDIDLIVSEMLINALEWEERDLEEAIRGIDRGLTDFEAGRSR